MQCGDDLSCESSRSTHEGQEIEAIGKSTMSAGQNKPTKPSRSTREYACLIKTLCLCSRREGPTHTDLGLALCRCAVA